MFGSGALRRRLLTATALALAGIAVVAWWRDGGKHYFYPRKWHAVDDGFLYRSGQIDRRLIEDALRDHGIDLVIDLAEEPRDDLDARAEREAIARLGIRRLALPLDGNGRGDPMQYVEALDAIAHARRDGEQVLVHCHAGTERTGGVTMLYRTLFEGWSGQDAFAEYERYRKRPEVWSQVAYFLDEHMDEIARGLVARGALPAIPEPLPVLTPADVSRIPSGSPGSS